LKLPEAIKNPTFAGFDLEDCILSVRHAGRTKKKAGPLLTLLYPP
jgi:hypothetical protein